MRARHASVLLAAAIAAAALAPASADAPPPPPAPILTWTGVSFDGAVSALPASTPVVLEFFAHWCPACQRFAPVYEAAAALIDDSVTVARVDCADDAALCNRFGVRSYPTVHFAAAGTLAAVKGAKDARGLATYGGAHDAAALAAWAKDEVGKMSGGGGDGGAAAKPAVAADTAALPAASVSY
jgi:thioredoxin-like negative regulator of GroEL